MASIHSKKGIAGRKTYYVVVSLQGRHKWIRAGTLAQAKSLRRDIEDMRETERAERLGIAARSKRVDEFFQEYTEHVRLRTSPNTLKRYRACLNAFVAFLNLYQPKVRQLSQVTPEVIEEYQQKRLESVELKVLSDGDKPGNHKNKQLPLPQTVNYEVSVLRSAFVWAHDRGLIPGVPTKKVKSLKPKPTMPARLLSREECRQLLSTARVMAKQDRSMKVFYRAFHFLLNTGLRSGELCNLTWQDIDLETGLIKIQPKEGWTPKSYSREFFLNNVCRRLLSSVKTKEGHVIADSAGRQLHPDDLRKALIKTAKAAGIKGLTRVHDLRHTFNSLMQMNGVDPATMGKILGHKDIETTMIYTHQTAEHLRKSINKIRIG